MTLCEKLINKTISFKKNIYITSNKNKKNALLSYILFPKLKSSSFYFLNSHINKSFSKMLAEALFELGFNVTITNCENFDKIDKEYSLFIGHTNTFSKYCKLLPDSCKKILLLTGSSPEYGNSQQLLRMDALKKRSGKIIGIYQDNIVPDPSENLELADKIILIGNSFTKNTWDKKHHSKIQLINNFSLLKPVKKVNTNKKFLFFSSIGQIHRGLDLLLDIFSKNNLELYVCSLFKKEKEFTMNYYKELYKCNNIHPIGWISLTSNKFYHLTNECDYAILPSCSEGQSSSLINLMARGLLPIASKSTGIDFMSKHNLEIDLDINDIQSKINHIIEMPYDKIENIRNDLYNFTETYHTYDAVKQNLISLLQAN